MYVDSIRRTHQITAARRRRAGWLEVRVVYRANWLSVCCHHTVPLHISPRLITWQSTRSGGVVETGRQVGRARAQVECGGGSGGGVVGGLCCTQVLGPAHHTHLAQPASWPCGCHDAVPLPRAHRSSAVAHTLAGSGGTNAAGCCRNQCLRNWCAGAHTATAAPHHHHASQPAAAGTHTRHTLPHLHGAARAFAYAQRIRPALQKGAPHTSLHPRAVPCPFPYTATTRHATQISGWCFSSGPRTRPPHRRADLYEC